MRTPRVRSCPRVAHAVFTDTQVVYGDTDSVMIRFGTEDLGRSMELAKVRARARARGRGSNPNPSPNPTNPTNPTNPSPNSSP